MDRSIFYTCILLAVVTVAAAGSGQPGERNRKKACGEWIFGECVPKRGTCGAGKKPGSRTGEKCRVTEREFRCEVPCPGEEGPSDLAGRTRGRDGRRKNSAVPCRYTRGAWSNCDDTTQQRTRTLTLRKGDETCESTKQETRQCKANAESCRYTRGEWSDCDATTQQRTRTLTLKKGDDACEKTKQETKECKANTGCKYQRGKWSECDATTNQRTRTLKLRRGDSTCEASKTETKACKSPRGCKYGHGTDSTWTPCEEGVMNLTLILKKGDPALCEPTQTRSKRCSSRSRREAPSGRCRYERSKWGECDTSTNTRTRTNSLKRGNSDCQQTQVETRKCKKACRYDKGEWSECNGSGMRQRTDRLKVKDGGDTSCQATRTVERKCASGRPNRRERCQFAEWGSYSECNNGVRTKTRRVVSGGEECQRRAVKTKPCRH